MCKQETELIFIQHRSLLISPWFQHLIAFAFYKFGNKNGGGGGLGLASHPNYFHRICTEFDIMVAINVATMLNCDQLGF